MEFDADVIRWAGMVCEHLMWLQTKHPSRWEAVERKYQSMPFGDLAYGMALNDWHKRGCPKNAAFSWPLGQAWCPFVMEFRKELTAEFGLPILDRKEAEEFDEKMRKSGKIVMNHDVFDWGPN